MLDRDGSQIFVGDLDPCFVIGSVERRLDTQSLLSCCATNQVHDDFSTQKRSGAPVFSDMTKHPVFNLVPFAGAGWEVADMDHHSQLVGQPLKFYLPQLHAKTIAPATVCRDEQFLGLGVHQPTHCVPPPPDGFDRKSCRVMGNAKEHLRLRLRQGGTVWDGVGFRLGNYLSEICSPLDIVYNLEVDRWHGGKTLRLNILDFEPSK